MVALIDFADIGQISCRQPVNDVFRGGRSSLRMLPPGW